MEGTLYDVRGVAPEQVIGWFAFSPNAGSAPSSSYFTGTLRRHVASVARSAQGVWDVTFKPSFTFPSAATSVRFAVSPACKDLTEYFAAVQLGAYNATTRVLQVAAHRAGTGYDVPDSTGVAKIVVLLTATNTTGK